MGKTDDVWEFDETYRGLCHEESLQFYRICLYKNYEKRQREFVQQELLISGTFFA